MCNTDELQEKGKECRKPYQTTMYVGKMRITHALKCNAENKTQNTLYMKFNYLK